MRSAVLGVGEIDHPVDRDLAPHEQAELVGRAKHRLGVRIMGEPDVIGVESLLGLRQQRARRLRSNCACRIVAEFLGMD
jgi:hypothetical protein